METCSTCRGARKIGCDDCERLKQDVCKNGGACPDSTNRGLREEARFCPTCQGRGVIISTAEIAKMKQFAGDDYFARYHHKGSGLGFSVHDLRGDVLLLDELVAEDEKERVWLANRCLAIRYRLRKFGGKESHIVLSFQKSWNCYADFSINGLILLILSLIHISEPTRPY